MTSDPLKSAVEAISTNKSYDVVIVCTTDDYQASYWMDRLSRGLFAKEDSSSSEGSSVFPMVLAVSEDWSAGGAGNGLGTLYAYQKACKLAQKLHEVDIADLLNQGKISAALYHTAGKGTRLAPLPASENNNKPGVKLPVCHEVDGESSPLTVLEAVVRQTSLYAPSRPGRLSAYWGDQVFIPSSSFEYKPTHHVDILCALGESAPTPEEWTERGLDKYGVIAVMPSGGAAQVEKVDHATAVKMLATLGEIKRVGPSLGSFSVSSDILNALCEEFSAELSSKTGKLDTDPHFWMPLTLPEKEYISLMGQKGVDVETASSHHQRMAVMKEKFEKGASSDLGMFGAVDVGDKACWWDYGQLKLYSKNNIKLIEKDENADLLRQFLGVSSRQMNSSLGESISVCSDSTITSCNIKSGKISSSVLCCVSSPSIEADGAIVVNCTAKKIVAPKGSILYNIVDDSDEGIVVGEGDVRVSVMNENGNDMVVKSNLSVCGGNSWKSIVEDNSMTFEAIMIQNSGTDIGAIEKVRKDLFKKTSSSFMED
mmetsp:Transcript_5671/g.8333  ORF Transcript_5671/g.8333 Transcript_5671/m.8333 type:complete len:540 (-) Transcript_5671:4027-5646(-)